MGKKKFKQRKDGEVPVEELAEMIADAVSEGEKRKSRKDGEDDIDATEVEVADVVAELLDEYQEEAKARKAKKEDDGEEWTDEDDAAVQEELVGAITDAVEDMVGEVAKSKGRKADDDVEDEEKEDEETSDEEEKRRKAISRMVQRSVKSALRGSSPALTRRKYADVFIQRDTSRASDAKKIPPAVQLARAVKCLTVFGKGDPEMAARKARQIYGDARMEREFKALAATNPVAGGYLVPEMYLDQIIELLYSKTVIFDLGAQKVPLANGNLNIPKMTSGSRAHWSGENRRISKSQPAFGNIKLSAKRLSTIIPTSRELLMDTSFSAEAIFANDLTRQIQLGLDFGALFGSGGEFQPLGITSNKGVEAVDVTTLSDASLVASGKITADFPVWFMSKALAKNIDDQRAGWTFNTQVEGYLMNLKTTTGAYIYRDEMQQGKLLGFHYRVTNQFLENTVATKFRNAIIFGNWADLIVGDQLGLEVYTSQEAAYTGDNGYTVSAFENYQSATRAVMLTDVAVRHDESFIIATNVAI
jgi:HK97 family phage major capsid protein